MTKYYALDGDNNEWEEYTTEGEALTAAAKMIDYYRDNCDPEWPTGVENIFVLRGERDREKDDHDFDGCEPLYRASEINKQELEPEDAETCGYDYSCDYAMRPYR